MLVKLHPMVNPSTGKNVSGYYITSDARVFKEIKGTVGHNGYRVLNLNRCKFTFHRIMARTFNLIVCKSEWVNHKDGNKLNNKKKNLEASTPQHNAIHAVRTNLRQYRRS